LLERTVETESFSAPAGDRAGPRLFDVAHEIATRASSPRSTLHVRDRCMSIYLLTQRPAPRYL
jgi:hypothetical protein